VEVQYVFIVLNVAFTFNIYTTVQSY